MPASRCCRSCLTALSASWSRKSTPRLRPIPVPILKFPASRSNPVRLFTRTEKSGIVLYIKPAAATNRGGRCCFLKRCPVSGACSRKPACRRTIPHRFICPVRFNGIRRPRGACFPKIPLLRPGHRKRRRFLTHFLSAWSAFQPRICSRA